MLKDMYRVPLASVALYPEDIDRVIETLRSGQLTMGSTVASFESKMSEYLGVDHFVMVNSGSSANLLMLEALVRPTKTNAFLSLGDTVLVPAVAWPTTIWPIIQLGLNPLFVDVDPNTLALDLNEARSIIETSNIPVRGVFPIHPLGLALDRLAFDDFAKNYDLVSISDVCESLGAYSHGVHAGTNSMASSFSFYFSHHITTMEGGGVATNSSRIADDLRSMRSHGWSRDRRDVEDWSKHKSSNDARFLFVSTGYNVRPMEIQAAIGINQISKIDEFIKRRRSIARFVYDSIDNDLMEIVGFQSFLNDENSHSFMLLAIQLKGIGADHRKANVLSYLERSGIETRPALTGNFLAQPAIQRITKQRISPDDFPIATSITQTTFLVSCHHDMTDEQVEYLGKHLALAGKL
jgi:CDP-6-deoxy-D-xylo-4-hexulose-3-dehydrase